MTARERKSNKKPAKKAKCLTPRCTGVAHSRGVCVSCYHSHRRAIQLGETTWEELQDAGLISPFQASRRSAAAQARKSAGINNE